MVPIRLDFGLGKSAQNADVRVNTVYVVNIGQGYGRLVLANLREAKARSLLYPSPSRSSRCSRRLRALGIHACGLIVIRHDRGDSIALEEVAQHKVVSCSEDEAVALALSPKV